MRRSILDTVLGILVLGMLQSLHLVSSSPLSSSSSVQKINHHNTLRIQKVLRDQLSLLFKIHPTELGHGQIQEEVKVTQEPYVIKDVCDRYDVNGCSIPLRLPFFYKHQFTPSCDRHDICYHCGVRYGISRLTCDETFQANMFKSCQQSANYVSTSWKGAMAVTGNGNVAETREHRLTILRLIEDKARFLKDVLDKTVSEMKRGDGDVYRLTNTPHAIEYVQKKVTVEWLLLLSRILYQDKPNWKPKHLKGKIYEEKHLTRIDSTVLKYEIGSPDSGAHLQNDTVVKPPGKSEELHRVGRSNRLYGSRLQEPENRFRRADDNRCSRLFQEADEKSTVWYRYRVSDMMDCQDIHQIECHFFADIYFEAVRVFGNSSYHNQAESFCDENFVKACLPLS